MLNASEERGARVEPCPVAGGGVAGRVAGVGVVMAPGCICGGCVLGCVGGGCGGCVACVVGGR